jgi:hypothetical protein
MLFKNGSFYRVYDSDTGAYTTMDATVGAASALAAVGVRGRVVFLSTQGIFWTDGVTRPRRRVRADAASLPGVADRVRPGRALLRRRQGRPREVQPPARGLDRERPLARVPPDAGLDRPRHRRRILLHDEPPPDREAVRRLADGQRPGVRAGQGRLRRRRRIACRYQTKWFDPGRGIETRYRRLRVFGRGIFDLYSKLDFDTGDGEQIGAPASLPGGALVWGSGLWAEESWAPANYEDFSDFWSLGQGTHISFVVKESSTASASAAPLLDTGTAPEVGAIAIYGLLLQFIPIGA